LAAGWTQLLGPGLSAWAQSFLGIDEVKERLAFVEAYMPPPRVVSWNEDAATQDGPCSSDRCVYVLEGARTTYGAQCGRVDSLSVTLRLSGGRPIQIRTEPGWRPIELTEESEAFIVRLAIPGVVPVGTHSWRARVEYESCPGVREPIPRFTPWWPVTVE
jgi:hypothetical protein